MSDTLAYTFKISFDNETDKEIFAKRLLFNNLHEIRIVKFCIEELGVPIDITTSKGVGLKDIALKNNNKELLEYVESRSLMESDTEILLSEAVKKDSQGYWGYITGMFW